MRAALSNTRVQIEQIMGMMKQLFQAKSADGGQQEEKSGGSGRGDTNDDSGGAGRAPREEGAAGTRVVATTATATGGKVSSHSSRALDGSRPAGDMSWCHNRNCCRGENIQLQQQSVGRIKTCRRHGPETRGSGWRGPDSQESRPD